MKIQDQHEFQSGLLTIAEKLEGMSERARIRAEFIDRPLYSLRITTGLLIVTLIGVLSVVALGSFLPDHLLQLTQGPRSFARRLVTQPTFSPLCDERIRIAALLGLLQ